MKENTIVNFFDIFFTGLMIKENNPELTGEEIAEKTFRIVESKGEKND